jgi:anaerobic dimethyl sulfoxide reductase subunit A
MITNNTYDQEFLDKYTVGFDADHMPEGASTNENFKDYVLGAYDGIPKTAEWASEICGTPVATIKSFAKELTSNSPLAFTCSRAPARTTRGDQFAQAFLTVGWMTGEVGKYGSMIGHIVTSNVSSGTGGPRLVNGGSSDIASIKNPVSPYYHYQIDVFDESDWNTINQSEMWDAILNKEYHHGVKGMVPIDIRMINHLNSGSGLNQTPGLARGIEAHRAVDFVLASGFHMHTNATYADIVLPVSTRWEIEGKTLLMKTNKETTLAVEQITEPLFESKSDAWIEEELATRFGVDRTLITPVSQAQQNFDALKGATVLGEDGKTKEPLFTITSDDIPQGVTGEAQQGRMSLKQFYEDKLYRLPRKENDNYGYTAMKPYIDDPVANPRETPSGKFEIYCQAISDWVGAVGFTTKSPLPKYQVPEEGYEGTFSDWDKKVKGDYPLQLFSVHSLRTVHSSFDNVQVIREAFPDDLQINPIDATARGINAGDTVLVTSRWGKCLRHAGISERIMPGVLKLDQCAWVDVDESTGIDNAGSPNYLIGPIKTGSGIQAWNSCNVQVEKWSGAPLDADYLWPQRIVEV